MEHILYAGAAKRDITPTPEQLPMPGASPFGLLTKALDAGAVRALALRSGGRTVLLVTEDIIGLPDADGTLKRLAERSGLREKDIFLFATHAHATPMIARKIAGHPLPEPEANAKSYLQMLSNAVNEAADEALCALRPARLGYGYGKSFLNVNRNQDYSDGNMLGVNPEGPSDKTAAVIRLEEESGAPIAFLFNYGVHAVVMHANRIDPSAGGYGSGRDGGSEAMGYSSDLPGAVSALTEEKYPGTVALWTSGPAGDQNPVYMSGSYFPDPKTGGFRSVTFAGGAYELLTISAARHFDDLMRINAGIHCELSGLSVATAETGAVLPGRTVLRPEGADRHARPTGYVDEGTFTVPMRLLKVGPLNLCCVSGELYTTLGQAIRSAAPDTLVLTHNMDSVGYIPDDEAIQKGSFGAAAPYQPGFAHQILPKAFTEMLGKAE